MGTSKLATCLVSFVGVTALLTGCRAPSPVRPPLDPLPLAAMVGQINANTTRITATLRASGPVDGEIVTPEGRHMSFHVNGVLFFLQPTYLRFDLKKLGERQLLLGSNAAEYWLYTKQDGEYFCGWHGDDTDLPTDLPIHPEQIADALALQPIDMNSPATQLIQRVVAGYQQLLFLGHDRRGRAIVTKEYWIDRHAPRVVRRVVFRGATGAVEMESELSDYKIQSDGSLYLPQTIKVSWPTARMSLAFSVRKWRLEPTVARDGPQFATPRECRP